MAEGYPDDLSALIQWPREERNLEFKRSMNWAEATTKAKLTKSVLAMANLRDGGHIVLGVTRQSDVSYIPVGMQGDHHDSFVQDDLSAYFSEYADPYIEVTLIKHIFEGKPFCILRVTEFAELPVLCKKDGAEKLRRGATYIRSRRIPETVEVPSQVEMRELLDLAVEKRSRAFARQAERMGFNRQPQRDEFVDQLKTLPESEILKKIRSKGYWRVWIRPSVFEQARFQMLDGCGQFVIDNAVQSGGRRYPFARDGAIEEGKDWVTACADLSSRELFAFPFVECWTLFRSGQFVYNFAMPEEFIGTKAWQVVPQYFVPGEGKRYLNIVETLKIVTCVYEFAARMASRQLLDPRASISIELHGTAGRELSYMSPKYILDERYWCRKESIKIERLVSAEELMTSAREFALDALIEIFGNFRWSNPPRGLFADEQARILG